MENSLFTIDRKDFKNLFEKQSGIVKFTSKKNYFDKKVFTEFSDLKEELKNVDNEDVKWYMSKTESGSSYWGEMMSYFLVKYNDMHYKDSWLNITDDKEEIFKSQFFKWIKREKGDLEITLKTNGTEKQDAISSWMYKDSYYKLKNMNYVGREKYEKKLHLSKMIFLLKNLNFGGKYISAFFGWSQNQTIDLLYLYFLLFESVTIFSGQFIFANNFKPIIRTEFIEKLYEKSFILDEKPKIKELEIYLNEQIKFKNKNLKYLIKGDIESVIFNDYLEKKWIINKLEEDESKLFKFFFETFKRFVDKGELLKIHSSINQKEGQYITKVINRYNLKKCLEVGCANGISALYILSSNKNVTLTSIDPFQSSQWKNQGIKLLKSSKLNKRHMLIEKKSYEAMPELLKKEEGNYDFIFIDGWHTFDYTLVDFFYADKLLRKGGIIIIDDATHLGVKKCLKYIDTNYKDFYFRLKSHNSIACYKKTGNDKRDWNYHKFF